MTVDVEIQALRAEYAGKLRELVEKHITALVSSNLNLTAAPEKPIELKRGPGRPPGPAAQAGTAVTAQTGKGPCERKGCTRPILAKKLCRNHYQQMRARERAKAAAPVVPAEAVANGQAAPASA